MPARLRRSPSSSSAPAVSVFLPTACRFGDGYLARAIDSLLAQDFAQWELLAVDDGSVDGSREYLAEIAQRDPRVRTIRMARNIGLPAFVLSRAWRFARAPLLAWLFDDCELAPDHLSTLKRELDHYPDCGMAYGCAQAKLAQGEGFVIGQPFDRTSAEAGRNVIPNVCVMLRRQVIDTVGWFDPHVLMKRLCDWDLWVRVSKSFPMRFVDRVIATEHGTSLPGSLGRMATQDMELVLAYAKTARDSRLHPSRLDDDACFRTDLGFDMTAAQRESLHRILLEHAFFTANEALALRIARLMAGTLVRDEPASTRRLMVLAAAQILRARGESAARNEIDHETQLRAALAAADARLKTIEALQSGSRSSALGTLEPRQAAENRDPPLSEGLSRQGTAEETAQRLQVVADQRLALIENLQALLKSTEATAQHFRVVADERYELLAKAQGQASEVGRIADERAAVIEQVREQLNTTSEAAQRFRAVADERLELLEEWQSKAADAEGAAQRFREAADQRLDILQSLQRQLDEARNTEASLREELRNDNDQLDEARRIAGHHERETAMLGGELQQARRRADELTRATDAMAADLEAARFRVDEARRVQRSLPGRFAFWLHRTFGR